MPHLINYNTSINNASHLLEVGIKPYNTVLLTFRDAVTHLAALVFGAALPPLLGLNLVHAALVRRFAAPHHGVGLHGCGIRESMITSIMKVNDHLYIWKCSFV